MVKKVLGNLNGWTFAFLALVAVIVTTVLWPEVGVGILASIERIIPLLGDLFSNNGG